MAQSGLCWASLVGSSNGWRITVRRRKKELRRPSPGLSGPGQALPVDISENEVAGWMEADSYFKMVAHNRQDDVNRDEFVHHMIFIEGVLLRRLQPTAVEDLDALDALVREGEHGH